MYCQSDSVSSWIGGQTAPMSSVRSCNSNKLFWRLRNTVDDVTKLLSANYWGTRQSVTARHLTMTRKVQHLLKTLIIGRFIVKLIHKINIHLGSTEAFTLNKQWSTTVTCFKQCAYMLWHHKVMANYSSVSCLPEHRGSNVAMFTREISNLLVWKIWTPSGNMLDQHIALSVQVALVLGEFTPLTPLDKLDL